MGQLIEQLFLSVKKEHGPIGLYRLVVKTRISEDQAKTMEDTEDAIKLVKDATDALGFVTKSDDVKRRRGLWGRILRRN